MFMTLSESDFGGSKGVDGKRNLSVCSFCGSTQICMPYVSTKKEGIKKMTSKEVNKERGPDECGCAYCYFCVKSSIDVAEDNTDSIPCP